MEKRKFRIISLLADILILAISFIIAIWFKPSGFSSYIPSHLVIFLSLLIIWITISLANGKLHSGKVISYTALFYRVISSNIISLSLTTLLMYLLRDYNYSRAVVFGTAAIASFLEIALGAIFLAYKKATVQDYDDYDNYRRYRKPSEYELVGETASTTDSKKDFTEIHPGIIKAIENECGSEMAQAVINMTGHKLSENVAVISTTTVFNISNLPEPKYRYIINLHRINDIKKLNDFIDAVNEKLECAGYFFCCVETKDQRKARILKKFPPVINYVYYTLDFIIKRVLPKLKMTRGIYFFLTRGENTVISRAEALGRLSRGGFRIKQESFIGNHLCIEARKISDPLPQNDDIYGPLIALPRVGKNGEMIKVFKLRTMHPYSEYIQDYVYKLHDLQDGGKFKNDFRITSWGGVCRKIWLDELPMFINFFKGNMKLIGVRPLSKQYFDLYREDVKARRIKYKPGLLPPFYADMPSDLDEIQASELKYLDAYDRHPLLTDIKYFFRSVINIVFRKARSN
jgi:lipopolysaccharide/colanic/teichoic acid biosynthesis glycosyltransferase